MKVPVVCPSCKDKTGKAEFENWKNDIGSCMCPSCGRTNSYTRSKAGVVKPMEGTSGYQYTEKGKNYNSKKFDK